ncbi:hypothetical protein M426DRAFT_161328 [Hypoxylon sp. CI-4A]|nr:hypothetical protein M426DRAFT_161328 [Hypoxylon sp. CI-4A]
MALFHCLVFASIARGYQLGWVRPHIDTSGGFRDCFHLEEIPSQTALRYIRGFMGEGEYRMHSFISRAAAAHGVSESQSSRGSSFFGARKEKTGPKSDTEERERREDKLVLLATYALHIPPWRAEHLSQAQRDSYLVSHAEGTTFATAPVI